MSERRARALERLLDQERHLIMQGQFDSLGDLTRKKSDALSGLGSWGLTADRMKKISAKVSRNQSLLDAAIRGIRAARQRVETVIETAGSLSTYTNSGKKAELGNQSGGLEKKA